MIEFQTKKGGRKLYNEDFKELQNLVNSMTQFFADCGLNFVMSGCQPDSNMDVEGYVFLDGKLRKLEKTNIKSMESPAITVKDTTESILYEDGTTGEAYITYGCKVIDLSTSSSSSSYIKYDNDRKVPTMAETFLAHYLIARESETEQNVVSDVAFNELTVENPTMIGEGNSSVTTYKSGENTVIQMKQSDVIFTLTITPSGAVRVSADGKDVLAIGDWNSSDVAEFGELTMESLVAKNIKVDDVIVDGIDVGVLLNTKDAAWQGIIDTSNNKELTDFQVCESIQVVHIQGALPSDFFSSMELVDSKYYSHYKIPDTVDLPSDSSLLDMPVITSYNSIGLMVYIETSGDYSGRFYISSDLSQPSTENTTSFLKSLGTGSEWYSRPCVAWQYIPDNTVGGDWRFTHEYEFHCSSYYDRGAYWAAYYKDTITIQNTSTGYSMTKWQWVEATYLGVVHGDESAPNYCNTYKESVYFSDAQSYYYKNTGCAAPTAIFSNPNGGYWQQSIRSNGYYNGQPNNYVDDLVPVYHGWDDPDTPPITFEHKK